MKTRINIMANWKEFNPSAKRSMKDDFSSTPSPVKKQILAYVNSGTATLVSPSSSFDAFTGERISATSCILTDGEYSWHNTLGYYIQKYNLRIPKELEQKIANEIHNYKGDFLEEK